LRVYAVNLIGLGGDIAREDNNIPELDPEPESPAQRREEYSLQYKKAT